ncbi:hypothetical protein AC1031_019643 [Aphanomyces cochlioides]|nr:hypothetical protein AC1031_019643 [Aphanomyces cochlioides]
MILRVPVADDFFKCAPHTPDQVEHFRQYGYESAHDLVEYTQVTRGIEWVLHTKLTASSGRSTQIYKAKEDDLPMYCAQTEVEATLDDLIAIFLTTNTQDAREANAAFFPDVPDIVRLYNITLPTPEKPHFCQAINWCLLSSPLRAPRRMLDLWQACVDSSVETRRRHMYIESDRPGFLKVIELMHCRAGGSLSGALGEFMTEIRYSAMNATQKQSRSKCAVCLKKFGAFTSRSRCRWCGEVVCRKASSSQWKLKIYGMHLRVRLCHPCSTAPVQSGTLQPLDTIMAPFRDTTTSHWSGSTTTDFSSYSDTTVDDGEVSYCGILYS